MNYPPTLSLSVLRKTIAKALYGIDLPDGYAIGAVLKKRRGGYEIMLEKIDPLNQQHNNMNESNVQASRRMTPEEITARNETVIGQIAEICHEANRSYCLFQGDTSQKEWSASPEWQKESAINGVKMHLANPHATPEDSHESWYAEKVEGGWKYGTVKDPEKKEHPCMVAYNELPYEQQMKDSIFGGIAKSMLRKAIASGRLLVDRPLTPGEEAVDVSFNVGGNPRVARVKQGFADLHDLCIKEANAHGLTIYNRVAAQNRKDLAKANPDWDADKVATVATQALQIPAVGKMHRLLSMALTDIENGAMHVVKAITR